MPTLDAVAATTLALLPLSMVNAAITTIITSSRLLDAPRQLLSRLTDRGDNRLNFFGELLTCDLCVGTWVGALIAGATVSWLGLTGWDAALAAPGIMFSTVTGGHFIKEKANLW
ncbi:MAG TPA: DUF1360 domain-containing protein [Dehalococcoidia bacterium]|nr:DUF1360 domain-containing protein [Dehalococcoidia bacterium]